MKFCGICGKPVSAKEAAPEQASAIPQPQPQTTAQITTPVNPAPTSATNVLMNEYYRAAEGQNNAAAAANTPSAIPQPERYSAAMPAVAVKPLKKKSKLLPACCIAAGSAAVIAGTGLIVYNCNKASFTHAAMGDAGYAHAVVMGTLTNSETTKTINRTLQSSGSSSMGLIGSSDMSGAGSAFIGSTTMTHDYSAEDMAGMTVEYMTNMVNEALNTSGLEVSLSASAELDKDFADDLKEMAEMSGISGSDFDKMLKGLQSTKIYAAEKKSGDALEYALALYDGNTNLGGAQFRYEKDGTATIIFPEISKNGISIDMPEFSWSDVKKEMPETYDFTKLLNSINERTRKVFDSFEYEYESGANKINGVDFNGITIKIELDYENICDLTCAVLEAALDDDDFIEYLAEISYTDKSEIKQDIKYAVEIYEQYPGTGADNMDGLEIEIYMNNDNTIAGASFSSDKDSLLGMDLNLSFISNGVDAAAVIEENGVEYLSYKQDGKSASEGSAKFEIYTGGYNDSSFSINFNYKNVGKMNVFGTPSMKGDFEIYLDSQTAEMITGGNYEIAEVLSNSKLLFSLAPNGKGAKVTVGAYVEDYGKFTVSVATNEPSGSVAPKPNNSYKLTEFDDIDDEFTEALGQDFMDYIQRLYDKGNVIGQVLYPTMSGMIEDAKITSANSAAKQIFDNTQTFLASMDTRASGLETDGAVVQILVQDGKWSVYSVDGEVTWRDGYDHLGSSSPNGSRNSDYITYISYMADSFSDMDNGFISVYLHYGRCAGTVYIEDAKVPDFELPTLGDFDNYAWDFGGSDTAGKVGSTIVGTCPMLSRYNYW